MLISKGSLDIFVSTPLAGSITVLAIFMLLWPVWGLFKKLSRG
jgi:putative tricarboxylic transport membrane protein